VREHEKAAKKLNRSTGGRLNASTQEGSEMEARESIKHDVASSENN